MLTKGDDFKFSRKKKCEQRLSVQSSDDGSDHVISRLCWRTPENQILSFWRCSGSVALTTRHPLSAKVGTSINKWWSLGRYSLFADLGHGACCFCLMIGVVSRHNIKVSITNQLNLGYPNYGPRAGHARYAARHSLFWLIVKFTM
jgi:hypothetical protein